MNTNCTYVDVKAGHIIQVTIHAWYSPPLMGKYRRCVDCGQEQIKTPRGAWIASACGKREERKHQ